MARYAILCGNGRFPVLALEAARRQGDDALAIAIKEEADPVVESLATATHWISLGQLGRLIEVMQAEGVTQIMFCGQVKHASIFSNIRPDWRMVKLLARLATKNTDALIGGVIEELRGEGLEIVESTRLLTSLLATPGAMTRHKPNREQELNIDYGRQIANVLSAHDIGQSVAIADQACVAVEAMEGTDAMLRRAASLANGKELTLVKASRRRKHMLFDVPVTGPGTIAAMRETGTRVLAVDAGRTLLLDKERMLEEAQRAGMVVWGSPAD